MKIHVIVITNLISINFISAFYDGFIRIRYGLSDGISETPLSDVDINQVCQAQHKKCLWRCCPPGKHLLARKECKPSNISFSNITVYDADFQKTSESFETVFQLVPGIMSDELFVENAFPWSLVAKPYLVEDGNLYLEIPNSFYRWMKIETNHFCVDMRVTRKGSRLVFLAESRENVKEYFSKFNYGSALVVTVIFILLTILPYALLPQLKDINGAIFIIFLTFFTIHMVIEIHTIIFGTTNLPETEYLITAMSYYYCFISSICWTNVMFYRILTSANTTDWTMKEVLLYCTYTVGLPLSLATLVTIIEITDMKHIPWFVTPMILDFGLCFFKGLESIYYLYIPLGLLLLLDWIVCVVTVVRFFKTPKSFITIAMKNKEKGLISPLSKTTQYMKLLTLLTMYGTLNILSIFYPHYEKGSDVCFFFTLFIGPVIFITFVIDKDVFTLTKQYFAKFRTRSLSSRSVQFRNGKAILNT